jgi:hypothetical protein
MFLSYYCGRQKQQYQAPLMYVIIVKILDIKTS